MFLKLLVQRNPVSWVLHEKEVSLCLLAEPPVIMRACLKSELTQIRAKQKDVESQEPSDVI